MRKSLVLFLSICLIFLLSIVAVKGQVPQQIKVMTGPEESSYSIMMEDINLIAAPVLLVKDTISAMKTQPRQSGQDINGDPYYEEDIIFPEIEYDTLPFVYVIPSPGSYRNYKMLIKDSYRPADVYFVQYDLMILEELRSLKNNLDVTKNVRVLMPFADAEIHLITRKNSEINSIEDLEKKKVGVDSEGTGITTKILKERTGINWKEKYIGLNNSLSELLRGNIDAFFHVGMAPIYRLSNASPLLKREIKMVSVVSDSLEGIYEQVTIPGGTYRWQEDDIETYGVKILLVTNIKKETAQDRANIRKFLETIRDNKTTLQSGDSDFHPKWREIKTSYSLKRPYYYFDAIDWKVHPVAKKLFR